jgi:hypothetical protein
MIQRFLEIAQVKVGIGDACSGLWIELMRTIVSRNRSVQEVTVATGPELAPRIGWDRYDAFARVSAGAAWPRPTGPNRSAGKYRNCPPG